MEVNAAWAWGNAKLLGAAGKGMRLAMEKRRDRGNSPGGATWTVIPGGGTGESSLGSWGVGRVRGRLREEGSRGKTTV